MKKMKAKITLLLLIILQSCMTISKQTKVIFEPETLDLNYQFRLPPNTKEIFIPVEQNVALNGLLYENKANDYLMIYFQGNSKNLQNFLNNHSMVLDWGYNVLVTDYRSFGKSTGKLSGETKMYADADIIFEYALKLGYQPDNIILYGYSMGTSMAAYLASTRKVKGVILESAYSSIPEISWVGDKAPAYKLNTAEKAKHINIPTLLIHGDKDNVITSDHSNRIFKNLKSDNKKKIILRGGGHGDLKQRPEYQKMINDFIDPK